MIDGKKTVKYKFFKSFENTLHFSLISPENVCLGWVKLGKEVGFLVEKKIKIEREEVVACWFVQCSGVKRREGAAVSCSKEQEQNDERGDQICSVVMGWWDVG